MKRNAVITIKRQKQEINEASFESVLEMLERAMGQSCEQDDIGGNMLSEALSTAGTDGGDEITELMTEGEVIEGKGGSVILQYNDTELTGMQGCVTKIMFNKKNPTFVVMMRDGEVNTSLSFEPKRRSISMYNTPFMRFDVCVNTLSVDNRFVESGEIEIEYLMDIRGLSTDRVHLDISVRYV